MGLKIVFVLTLIIAVVHISTARTLRKRDVQDVPTTASDAGKAIDEAVDQVKSSLDDFLKNIQSSDVIKELGDVAKKFGEQIETQGKDLIAKIQSSANSATSSTTSV